jgi:hypothetical protein
MFQLHIWRKYTENLLQFTIKEPTNKKVLEMVMNKDKLLNVILISIQCFNYISDANTQQICYSSQ